MADFSSLLVIKHIAIEAISILTFITPLYANTIIKITNNNEFYRFKSL